MSTTSRHGDPEAASDGMVPFVKQHKRLAPKAVANLLMSHEKSIGSNPDQQMQQEDDQVSTRFAFINTTTSNQYSGRGSRSAARSHVMRNFHWKKGKSKEHLENPGNASIAQSWPTTTQVLGLSHTSRDSLGFYDVHSPGLHSLDEKAIKSLMLLQQGSDPDNRLALWQWEGKPQNQGRDGQRSESPMSNLWALPIDPHTTGLIHHYIQVFAKTFLPMSQTWESEWFSNALSDPACFHSTLFLSVAHKALLTGTNDPLPVQCFQHKGEAIRIINERLGNATKRVSDGTIATIACLAAFETLSGTASDATVHVDGLQKLVSMRGGLKQLGMNGFLKEFLYWVDLSNATAIREKPHFLPFEVPSVYSTESDSDAIWNYCDSQWNDEFLIDLPMKSFQGLDFVEAGLFHRLRQLVTLAASNPFLSSEPVQQAYAKSVLLLERQISVAVQQRLSFKNQLGGVTFSPPTCIFYIPALVICYMILRPTPVRASIYDGMVTRMKHHTEQLATRQLFERFPLALWLWALLFVGAASMGRPEHAYFRRVTMQLCNLMNVHSWEKAKALMADFAWADSICERPCKAFWDTLEGVEDDGIEEEVGFEDHSFVYI